MVTVHSNLNFSRFQVLLTRCKSSLTVWREATIIGLSSESEESCYVDKKTSETSGKKSLKSNYQKMVSVCFLIAFLTTSFASSTFIFRQFRPGLQTIFVQTHMNFPDASNSSIATDTLQHVFQIFVFRCTTGNSVRTHPQYVYQRKIFSLCRFKDSQRGLS